MTLAIRTRPEHAGMPVIECEFVRLTRSRFARVCLCGHPKVVHEHWRTALDCGVCDCLHYETARNIRARDIIGGIAVGAVKVGIALNLLGILALGACLAVAVGGPLIRAIASR